MSLEDNSKELTLLTSAFARDDAEPTSANDQETGTMGRTLMSARDRQPILGDDHGKGSGRTRDPTVKSASQSFKALFTVIEDSVTGEQHYPRVHYVFSDDDPGITTDVALRALNRDTARYGEGGEPVDIAQSTASVETSIIVDLADDGETVQEVRSLSPEWQVFEHSLTPAPSCSEPNAASEESLMLRIVGRGIPLPHPEQNEASQAASNDQRSDQSLLDRIETLSRQFNQGLEEIRKLAQRPQQEGQQRSPNRS